MVSTKTKTSTKTMVAVLVVGGIMASAAAAGYIKMKDARDCSPLTETYAAGYLPGYQTPGYGLLSGYFSRPNMPGYQTPGYQTPGYQTPGYGIPPCERRGSLLKRLFGES